MIAARYVHLYTDEHFVIALLFGVAGWFLGVLIDKIRT